MAINENRGLAGAVRKSGGLLGTETLAGECTDNVVTTDAPPRLIGQIHGQVSDIHNAVRILSDRLYELQSRLLGKERAEKEETPRPQPTGELEQLISHLEELSEDLEEIKIPMADLERL